MGIAIINSNRVAGLTDNIELSINSVYIVKRLEFFNAIYWLTVTNIVAKQLR